MIWKIIVLYDGLSVRLTNILFCYDRTQMWISVCYYDFFLKLVLCDSNCSKNTSKPSNTNKSILEPVCPNPSPVDICCSASIHSDVHQLL